MKIKKWLASGLAFMMILSTVSCGNASSSSESDSSTAASSSTAEAKGFKTKTDGSKRITVDGTKFLSGGKEIWFNGVNTPWQKWNDFGGGGFDFEFWQDHFRKLHEAGVNCSRVWISCDGTTGMNITADGTFKGVSDQYWTDLDNLFLLAEQYHIYIMATVQSFDNYKDKNKNYKAWRALVQDNTKTNSYVDNFITPLAKRYGSSDYLWSIDLCNEPDWIVENDECGKLDWSYLQQYYAKAAAAIHANSKTLVTVGIGMIKYNSDSEQGNKISNSALEAAMTDTKYDKSKAYVDFYSTHWYPWMESNWDTPYETTPKDFGLDGTKPCVLGELPARDDNTSYKLTEVYKGAYKNGWNGVLAWKSSGTDDGCGLWADIEATIKEMATTAGDKIFPLNDQKIS